MTTYDTMAFAEGEIDDAASSCSRRHEAIHTVGDPTSTRGLGTGAAAGRAYYTGRPR